MNTEKAPHHIAKKVMLYFFDVVKKRKNSMHDVFGTEALTLLVGTLAAINAPTKIWGEVTDFVLARATKGFSGLSIYYEGILCSLAPHVSAQALAKITNHFANVGRLETLTTLTTTYLKRGPSYVEVLMMAKSHCEERGAWTDPENKIWDKLLSLAGPNDVQEIKELREEAVRRQKRSDDCIL